MLLFAVGCPSTISTCWYFHIILYISLRLCFCMQNLIVHSISRVCFHMCALVFATLYVPSQQTAKECLNCLCGIWYKTWTVLNIKLKHSMWHLSSINTHRRNNNVCYVHNFQLVHFIAARWDSYCFKHPFDIELQTETKRKLDSRFRLALIFCYVFAKKKHF